MFHLSCPVCCPTLCLCSILPTVPTPAPGNLVRASQFAPRVAIVFQRASACQAPPEVDQAQTLRRVPASPHSAVTKPCEVGATHAIDGRTNAQAPSDWPEAHGQRRWNAEAERGAGSDSTALPTARSALPRGLVQGSFLRLLFLSFSSSVSPKQTCLAARPGCPAAAGRSSVPRTRLTPSASPQQTGAPAGPRPLVVSGPTV